MNTFILQETKNTPSIIFIPSEKKFLIKGKCFPENSKKFFEPLIRWIENNPIEYDFNLVVNFDYISSASVVSFLELIRKMAKINPNKIEISWIYEAGDDDSLNIAKNLERLSGIKFNCTEID
jgi:hypothetical protein